MNVTVDSGVSFVGILHESRDIDAQLSDTWG